jgi:hypothetical protein
MRTHDSKDELTHSYKVDAFPPAAEVRREVTGEAGMTDEDLRWFKRRSIARNGTERPTAMQQKGESHFYDVEFDQRGSTGLSTMSHSEESSETPRIAATDERRQQVCKALYDEALQTEGADGFVLANDSADRISEYLDATIEHRSQLWALIDDIPEEYVEVETRDDGVHLRCTRAGATDIFQTGSGTTSGGPDHRALLKDAYDPLSTLGLRIDLPEQTGADQPDGVGTAAHMVPSVETDSTMSLRERQQMTQHAAETFASNYPRLAHLTDGGAVSIEAETSTGETKPAQTLFNLAGAVNSGRRCLFICREDTASSIRKTLTDPPYCTTHGVTDGTRFYNHLPLRIDGDEMLRPANGERTVWTRDEDGEYRLSGHTGEEYARFPTASAVFDDPSRYPATSATVDAADDEWTSVPKPFIPECAFDGELPARDDWHILVVPPDATAPDDLSVFVDGEMVSFGDTAWFREESVDSTPEKSEVPDSDGDLPVSTDQPRTDSSSSGDDEDETDDTDDGPQFRRF